jgi:predicted nucleic acid-binding protein
MILVDTNAWVNHLRKRDSRLVLFLSQQRVRTCDVVVGELLLGSGLPKTFASDLAALPHLPSPSATDTRAFINRHRSALAGAGVGWAECRFSSPRRRLALGSTRRIATSGGFVPRSE